MYPSIKYTTQRRKISEMVEYDQQTCSNGNICLLYHVSYQLSYQKLKLLLTYMPVLRSNLYSKLVNVSKLESNEYPEEIKPFTCEHTACDNEQNDSTHSHLSCWECNNGRSFYFTSLAA